MMVSFGSTEPPACPENEVGGSSRDVGKPSRLDAAVCPRIFH